MRRWRRNVDVTTSAIESSFRTTAVGVSVPRRSPQCPAARPPLLIPGDEPDTVIYSVMN